MGRHRLTDAGEPAVQLDQLLNGPNGQARAAVGQEERQLGLRWVKTFTSSDAHLQRFGHDVVHGGRERLAALAPDIEQQVVLEVDLIDGESYDLVHAQ